MTDLTVKQCRKHSGVTVQYIAERDRCFQCIEDQLNAAPEELQYEVHRLRRFKTLAIDVLVANKLTIDRGALYG